MEDYLLYKKTEDQIDRLLDRLLTASTIIEEQKDIIAHKTRALKRANDDANYWFIKYVNDDPVYFDDEDDALCKTDWG